MLRGRSVWVEVVAREIGAALRLPAAPMRSLLHAALLHDIGLVAPASRSLGTQLTGAEREWILEHPRQGMRMLDGIDFLAESRSAAEHHHERWDGRGYPDGLREQQIPRLARILSVADAYCALMLADAGRADADVTEVGFANIAERSLTAVEAGAYTQFDPVVVDALRRAHERVIHGCSALVIGDPPQPMVGVDPHLPWVSEMFAAGLQVADDHS
ncbi:MAG: HD domain-containing protein [Actinomycetota bacterium]|nr:HD domain-containing protein [Actinomycetota bacterium]